MSGDGAGREQPRHAMPTEQAAQALCGEARASSTPAIRFSAFCATARPELVSRHDVTINGSQ
jgi:hypothetical protein